MWIGDLSKCQLGPAPHKRLQIINQYIQNMMFIIFKDYFFNLGLGSLFAFIQFIKYKTQSDKGLIPYIS